MTLKCFKAYDIRGRLPDELNPEIAWRTGKAYAEYFKPKTVITGGDVRLSTPELKQALNDGLRSSGVHVKDIGLCGTEEVYFSTFHLQADGGIMVTASHNPANFNGMKLVKKGAAPVSVTSGLQEIRTIAESVVWQPDATLHGSYKKIMVLNEYIAHLCGYININALKPLKLVVNAGNGAAGHVIDKFEELFSYLSVPVQFIKIQHEPDGRFPNGVPNPLLTENRQVTADAVKQHNADMGIAWDGDFDRCFLFDEQGRFIEGYYIVGLLANAFLEKKPGAKIIYDPRLTWNTIDIVNRAGGQAVMSKAGHAFIKERMRQEDAVYGGEMSAHHYFRDFAYCDSGMIPWLLVAEMISESGKPLSALVEDRVNIYPSSGEINMRLKQPQKVIDTVLSAYRKTAKNIDHTDGISLEFDRWRFNLRQSNTESLVRLNVESHKDKQYLNEKTEALLTLMEACE